MAISGIELVIGIVLLVAFAAAWGSRRCTHRGLTAGLRAFLVMLVLLTFVVGGLFFVRTVAPVSRHVIIDGRHQSQAVVVEHLHAMPNGPGDAVVKLDHAMTTSNASVTIAGTPWTSAVEEHQDFEADVYPSIESAAEAVGRRVGQHLLHTWSQQAEATQRTIRVWSDNPSLLDAASRGLGHKLGDAAAVVPATSNLTDDVLRVTVTSRQTSTSRTNNRTRVTESGELTGRMMFDGTSLTATVRFEDVPWIADPVRYSRDGQSGPSLVAYSQSAHASQSEAASDVLHAAAEALVPQIQAHIAQLSSAEQHRLLQQIARDPNWFRQRIASELTVRNPVIDRFTQRFDRPYGSVWREAALLNADPALIDDITHALSQSLGAHITHRRTTLFSFVALAALIFGTYLFLNAATKGYYAWSLRMALLLGVIAVGAMLLILS